MSLKRGLFYTLLTQAPTLVLYFVASTVMTRMLGDVGRGEYALITNHSALLSMLMSFNISFGITYFASRTPDDHARIIATASTVLLFNILVVPLVLLLTSLITPLTLVMMPVGRLHWPFWGYIYVNVVLSMVNTSVASLLLAAKRFNVLNWMSLFNAGLSAAGMVAIYLFPGDGQGTDRFPDVLLVSTVTMALVSAVWCVLYMVHVNVAPWPSLEWATIRPILRFSLVSHLSNLINLINYRFDVWVVGHYSGEAQLGLYAVAVGIGQLLFNVPEPFSRVMQPFLFGQVRQEMLSRFKAVARVNFSVLLLLALFLALSGGWVIPWLFGSEFAPSVGPLCLLLPGIVLSGAAKLLAQLVIQGGRQRFNLIAAASAAVVTIVLDLVLIPRWGIHGAAIATSLAYATVLGVILHTIRTRLGIPVHDLFLLRLSDLALLSRQMPWSRTK